MTWGVSVATTFGGGAAIISGTVGLMAWRHRTKWIARPFMALALTLAAWSLCYGIQLGHGTLAEQLAWQRVALGLAGFVPITWLLFVLAYTDRQRWLTRARVMLLLLEPVGFLLLCLTNPYHGLVWTDAVLRETPVGVVPSLDFGLGYAVHIVFAYDVVAVGIGLLVLYGTQVAPTYQKQVLLLVTAAVPPFLSHIAFTLGASPIPPLDLTPFVFAFSGVIFGLALFRFELLELAPIARNQALMEVGDGLVVVNQNDDIVDVFGVATEVLEPTPHVGDPISTVFPDTDLAALDGSELTTNSDGQRRVYQFQVSPITAHPDRPVGTILILRDITGLRASNQRLSVSNRVLRHNLRNDMTVVLGYASELEARLDGQAAEDARQIRVTVEGFLELAEKARQITQLPDVADGGETTIDAVEGLRAVVDDLRTAYPDVDFHVDAPDEARIDVFDPEAFGLAIRNVLDNAARHNDAADPRVEITVVRTAAALRVAVTDNGPGIPEIERRAIQSKVETALEHSDGLGLWVTHWAIALLGGELELESVGEGTTVTLTLPGDGLPDDVPPSFEDAMA